MPDFVPQDSLTPNQNRTTSSFGATASPEENACPEHAIVPRFGTVRRRDGGIGLPLETPTISAWFAGQSHSLKRPKGTATNQLVDPPNSSHHILRADSGVSSGRGSGSLEPGFTLLWADRQALGGGVGQGLRWRTRRSGQSRTPRRRLSVLT